MDLWGIYSHILLAETGLLINRLFGKQYGTVCSSVLLLRISNIEINTAIYNKDTLNNIIYSDKKLSIKLKAIYGEGMSPLQYIQMIQLCT